MIKEQKSVRAIEFFEGNKELYAIAWFEKGRIPWVNGNPPEFIFWNRMLWKFIWRRADDLACGYEKAGSFVNTD